MKYQEYLRLNVVLKPSQNVSERAIVLSKKITEKYETAFVLDGVNFHPHITLYSPEYPIKNIDKILSCVAEIAAETKELKMVALKPGTDKDFVVIKFGFPQEAKELYNKVVMKLNPLREGHYEKKYDDPDYRAKIGEEQKKNIEEYGYPRTMNLYSPHLTITRLKEASVAGQAASELQWDLDFTVDTIGVYKMGANGTCTDLVKEFKLATNN